MKISEKTLRRLIRENIERHIDSCATYIFANNEYNTPCILAAKRTGNINDPMRGYFNVPVGMKEPSDNSAKDCAIREIYEETGLALNSSMLAFVNYEPWGHGKIGANFCVFLPNPSSSYHIGNGDGENERFSWIPLNSISNYRWAYGMDRTVISIYNAARKQ